MTIRIAVVGFGKIARDEHVPAIAANSEFDLVAVATASGDPGLGLPWFADLGCLIAGMADGVDAIALCTPPAARHSLAMQALDAGLAVLLEKPPAATLGEVDALVRRASQRDVPLYASWHSQHASGVERARAELADERITRLAIDWREDVRKWHPGQQWIWQAGNYGVFDPGINGLSIASRILPMPLLVKQAQLYFPANRQAPIAADIVFQGDGMAAQFDWRSKEGENWRISVATASGKTVDLSDGGQRLLIDGVSVDLPHTAEYSSIYRRFGEIVRQGCVDVDREPMRIVADAFLVGQRIAVEAFDDEPAAAAGTATEYGARQ